LVWPSFALRWWRQRTRHNLVAFGTVLGAAVIQGVVLVVRPRPHLGLESDVRSIVTATLLRIWGLLGLGEHTLTWHVFARPLRSYVFVLAVLGVALTIAAVLALPWVARLQIAGVFAMSVAATAWAFDFNMRGAAESSAHGRYFLIPAVLVLVAVFAAANTAAWRKRVVRLGVIAPALLLFSFAVTQDLGLPAMQQTYWATTAKCIDHHMSCTVVMDPRGFTFELPPIK
jgi:hypothetical protein